MDGYGFDKAELDALERVLGNATAEPMSLTLPLLKHITNDFSHENLISNGGFAVVYLGTLPNGSRIAVKRFASSQFSGSEFYNEVDIGIKVAHKNIVRLIGYCHDTTRIPHKHEGNFILAEVTERLLCMEYVPNGTLLPRIIDKFHEGLDWNQRYQILKGIFQALSYLHDEVRVIHGDIKPSNVLLEDNFVPKLFHFGLSMCLGEGETSYLRENIGGTIGYLAPEVIDDGVISFKSDIYSLGLMILEITTRLEIKGDHGKLIKSVEENWREESQIASLYTSLEPDKQWQVKLCIDIGLDCVKSKPEKRPTARDIMVWLDKGSKPVPVPRAGAGGVPRPPIRTSITQADDHIQDKMKSFILGRREYQRRSGRPES